tara:strand:+ start:7759 stop:8487 length:729 start_codon:yes stop_codon:yes gene_type:complete
MSKETITEVKHLTEHLFSFKTTRSPGFRFEAGQFTMIGLDNTPKRAYSMVSGPADDYLEFLSIVVENGPLTSELVKIKVGDTINIGKKAVGTLITDSLTKGKNLWLIGTGTGIAPFVSICRDAKSYTKFEKIIVCHTVRTKNELAYYDYFFNLTMQNMIQYYPTVTRDKDWPNIGRITNLIYDNTVFKNLELPKWNPETDAVMLCGSTDFNKEMMTYLNNGGWIVGTLGEPATYVYEKAFVG